MAVRVHLPRQFALLGEIERNPISQLQIPYLDNEFDIIPYDKRGIQGFVLNPHSEDPILVATRKTSTKSFGRILLSPQGIPTDREQLADAGWLRPSPIDPSSLAPERLEDRCKEVLTSWRDQFFFVEEQYIADRVEPGLRPPQIGALYAALAHWKMTEDIGTIVMPTGTGKTESMLAIFCRIRPERLLVIVPTSALREQTTDKFVSLGLLKRLGTVGADALFPVVGKLDHQFDTREQVRAYFRSCNVVVSTMSVISGCSDDVQSEIARQCSHLFIDEAHHAPAATWDFFRQGFLAFGKPVLQFTATPFRQDGRHIGGKVIFNYPLRKAQEEGYFTPINFLSVWEYDPDKADETIAQAAIAQIEQDLAEKHDHIVMARTGSIERAIAIHQIYMKRGSRYNPLLIHSRQTVKEKKMALDDLHSRHSRIVVCVNMLGEGFDLPQLKIAAIHDVHKSLAVTIQFTGRFTRTASDGIGEATVIANGADAEVEEALEDLYAKDSDWNKLLRHLSEGATGRQIRRSEFLDGFTDPPAELPLQNIYPKMSTVVYRTSCADWNPGKVRDIVKEDRFFAGPTVNNEKKVLLFVTKEESPVIWGQARGLQNVVYDLYLFHWSTEQNLLYINSTNNRSLHTELAQAIAGNDVELIRGEPVYRILYGINRLILMNLGLLHLLSRAAQFTMHVGSDVKAGLSRASLQNRRKSNLFGYGYEEGQRVSIGGSHKGRVWAHKVAEGISDWVEWCHRVGTKLTDNSISAEKILDHVIVPDLLTQRPDSVPLTIEWSEYFLVRNEETVQVEMNGTRAYFYEVGLEITSFSTKGPIRFLVFTEEESIGYEVVFHPRSVEYRPIGTEEAYIVASGRYEALSTWFQQEPPIIRFESNGFLVYNEWYQPKDEDREPFDYDLIETWIWNGIDLRKESKMAARKSPPALLARSDSIQGRVIDELLDPANDPDYDIVFDDDNTNEIADVVAIKVAGDRLLVHLFHCKYSQANLAGARVSDLYEVCGQAQRSVFWKSCTQHMFEHLKVREAQRQKKYGISRFEKGDRVKLDEIARRARYLEPDFSIWIVQPGLSKSKVTTDQLDLLGATELYLQETYAVDLTIIASN